MLEPLPTRGVSRFMLPLADVMTLLFSLFLLLPHLEQEPGRKLAAAQTRPSQWDRETQRRAEEELERLRRVVQLPTGERLYVVVLDIDANNGDLVLIRGLERVRVTGRNIESIVREHRGLAQATEQKLFYLLRRPPVGPDGRAPRHPTREERLQYGEWLRGQGVEFQIEPARAEEV